MVSLGVVVGGQVLVYQDLLAMYGEFKPKFVKVFEDALKLNEKVLRSMTMCAVEVKVKPAPAVAK